MEFFSIFTGKKKEEYLKKINELEKKLEEKEKEISNLIQEIEKGHRVNPKQIQIFEKNITENRDKALKYKKILDSYRINPEKSNRYRVDIEKFYPKTKFSEILEILEKNNVKYLDELNEIKFHSLLGEAENLDLAKKKYTDFKNGKCDWEIITAINKGEKVSKYFQGHRKLIAAFSTLNIEFMDDLNDLDLNSLIMCNIDSKTIEKFKERKEEYFKERKIIEEE